MKDPMKIMEFLTISGQHGYSPSIREIGKYISVDSTSLVDYYLNSCAKKGISNEISASRAASGC